MQIALLLPRINSLQFRKPDGRIEAAAEPLGKLMPGFGNWYLWMLPITDFFAGWMDHTRKVNPAVTFSHELMDALVLHLNITLVK